MSHLTRDLITHRTARKRLVGVAEGSDEQTEAVNAALRDCATKARADFPKVFKKVDKIKTRPRGTQHIAPFDYHGTVLECRWCGDFFPADAHTVFCSIPCHDSHRRWNKKRRNLKRKRALVKRRST